MAYIEKTPSGKYRAHVDKLGVRDSETFVTKAEARSWATKREAEIQATGRGEFPRVTLGDALDEYGRRFSPKKEGGGKELLRIAALKRDFPWLAAKVVSETTTADWARWRDERLTVVTGATVLRDITLWSHFYHKARRELGPYCAASPITDLDRPADSPFRDALWDWRTTKRVLSKLGYKPGRPPAGKSGEVAYAILVALRTAMRAQEVLSLSDENTDLATRVATVNHKMQYCTGEPRKVPMQRQAVRLLAVLQAHAAGGPWFTMTPSQLDGLWRKRRDQLLITGITFHDTRATAITRLARKHDVLTLSAITGIKDLRMLNERYYRETATQIAARL